jgi:type VI secretion system (T6SS) effector TldE1-like protein
MTHATRSAAGRSVPGRRRRARRFAVGAVAVTTLIAPVLLLAAAGAMSASLAAHSGGYVAPSRGLETMLRADPYGRDIVASVSGSPDRLIESRDPQDPALAWQDDTTGSVPVNAGACGRARAVSLVSPMATAGDLAFAARGNLAGPPCLTVAETRATALAATRMVIAPNAPVRVASLMPATVTDVPPAVVPATPQPADIVAPPASRPRHDQEHGDTILRAPETRTAIYDISARTVYLPDGRTLEAHSGLGRKMDDPRFVHVRMQGATPPNVYDLRLRESLFHGVQAIRLTPVDGSKMFGRDGMLAHSYLLGPNGQSHGCVSFRNYPAFLQAFQKGEVKRLVVVRRLESPPPHANVARGADRNRVALSR